MQSSIIAWTDVTWNPVFGCSRVSEGCRNCYAEQIALKFKQSDRPWTAQNASENVRLKPHKLREPYKLKEPSRIFVNSMSDMFHPLIPDDYLYQMWHVMLDLPQHTFQILTKRPERAAQWHGPWPPHIWQGTSVENRKALPRIDILRRCGAAVRFLSIEPLLEDLGDLDLTGIHWVIVGGESGPNYRPMDHAWARRIRDQCVAQGVAFFFKQSAARLTERGTQLIEEDGSFTVWQQYPQTHTTPQQLVLF